MNLDQKLIEQVAKKAAADAGASVSWSRAIARAREELATNPWIARTSTGLLIASPSGELYEANGTCQCKAAQHNIPCWHRAAARLVQRYEERLAEQVQAPRSSAYEQALKELEECFA